MINKLCDNMIETWTPMWNDMCESMRSVWFGSVRLSIMSLWIKLIDPLLNYIKTKHVKHLTFYGDEGGHIIPNKFAAGADGEASWSRKHPWETNWWFMMEGGLAIPHLPGQGRIQATSMKERRVWKLLLLPRMGSWPHAEMGCFVFQLFLYIHWFLSRTCIKK